MCQYNWERPTPRSQVALQILQDARSPREVRKEEICTLPETATELRRKKRKQVNYGYLWGDHKTNRDNKDPIRCIYLSFDNDWHRKIGWFEIKNLENGTALEVYQPLLDSTSLLVVSKRKHKIKLNLML